MTRQRDPARELPQDYRPFYLLDDLQASREESIERRFENGASCANLTPSPSPLAERGVEG